MIVGYKTNGSGPKIITSFNIGIKLFSYKKIKTYIGYQTSSFFEKNLRSNDVIDFNLIFPIDSAYIILNINSDGHGIGIGIPFYFHSK